MDKVPNEYLMRGMKHGRTTVFLSIILITLFSGCLGQNGCSSPYVKIGDSCCVDGDGNGVCDRDEAQTTSSTEKITSTSRPAATSTTLAPTTTSIADTIASTTSSASTSTTLKSCKTSADCGQPYLGGCTCSGEGVAKTRYRPICTNGACTWRGEVEVDKCVQQAGGSRDREHCVIGYARCIPDSEYQKYFILPEDAELLDKLSYSDYSAKYGSYKFRINNILIPGDSVCYDDVKIVLDVLNSKDKSSQIEITRDQTAKTGDIEIGLNDLKRTVNGTIIPTLWVMDA